MWTHTVLLVDLVDTSVRARVEFQDDSVPPKVVRKEYLTPLVTGDWLKTEIARTLSNLEVNSAFLSSFTPGPIDVTPTPKDPPTEDQLAQQEALRDKTRLAIMTQEIQLGIRKVDNAEYAALVAKLSKAVDDGVLDIAATPFILVK